MILSYKYRIEPTRTQAAALSDMLADFCSLYNAALEERIGAWRRGVGLNFYSQSAHIRVIRSEIAEHKRWSATAQQLVLRRLDKAYKAFFARVKRGEKAGFPRYRSVARYDSADFRIGDGLTLRKTGRLGIVGVPGEIKVRWHRALPNTAKSAIVFRRCGKWYAIFHVDAPAQGAASRESVGIDVGLSSLVALSNGEIVPRPGWTKRAARGLRKRQKALARCQRGSKNRSKRKTLLARYQQCIANKRRDHLHKLSRSLVARFGQIAIEDLNVKGLARSALAKHVHDASWAQLAAMLTYKAENAGGAVVLVDPRGTSQTCPECGTVAVKTLKERQHRCECGCVLDRDVAAAKVIHLRAFGFSPGTGHGQLSEPVAA